MNIGSEMQEISSNNKRIAKNTLLLYFRMLVTMAVSLYTSRVVLNILGVEDFGIYNVVGGIVAMFGFINGSMTSATQRYLTFELGQNNRAQLTKVFSTSLSIHGIISFLIIVLAETVGLWFLWNKMQIPADRMNAAFWVFQCSVAASVIMIMSVPYNAAIIAHERMSAFAYISIIEVSLKLLIVCFLRYFHTDKLILYAVLIVIVQFLIRLCYSWYCNRHFNETKYRWSWDKGLFKEMTGFASWNMFGSLAAITFTQGLNLLLNMFFGPVVNAARGIAVQAQTAIGQFSSNFQTALNPQITKSYATGDMEFCDPDEINFLQVNEDPIPTFHELEKNYSSGYLNVPVVGAGTANTEFEMLTGLSMQYFGTGEYPYKTILKQTDCESIASDLSKIGYATHVVHNNGGNFYSRTNAFSKLGFDTFTSKELMNITEYTPNGSWPTDDILVSEAMKTFDATPDQSDFTYIITVGTHGDYPKEPVIENPTYTVSGVEDEGMKNAWTYYVNQLNEADRFIKELTDELSKRDEDTIVVMFGDHLPTMGLQDSDMKSGDPYFCSPLLTFWA